MVIRKYHSLGVWLSAFVALVMVMFAVQTGVSFLIEHQQAQQYDTLLQQSERKWCNLLDTLTATPVPRPAHPAKNPSREQTYEFYLELVGLRTNFGCGK